MHCNAASMRRVAELFLTCQVLVGCYYFEGWMHAWIFLGFFGLESRVAAKKGTPGIYLEAKRRYKLDT